MAPSTTRWSAVRVTVMTQPADDLAVLDDGALFGRADGEDADLGEVEDGVELLDAVHAEVARW